MRKKATLKDQVLSLERQKRHRDLRVARLESQIDELWRQHNLAISAGDDYVEELRNRLTEVEDVSNKIMAERLMFGDALQRALRTILPRGRTSR